MMCKHVMVMVVMVVVVVVVSGEAHVPTSQSNDVEVKRAEGVQREGITYLLQEEAKREEEEEEEEDSTVINMIMARPEVVTVLPDWNYPKVEDPTPSEGAQEDEEEEKEEEEERKRRRPHATRKARKRRGRRRKWKKKEGKKYYRRHRTSQFGAKRRRKGLRGGGGGGGRGLQTRQRHHPSPNQGEAWMAGRSFRTLDPRRVKVRRHLVHQHNLLRSKVDPPASDMLAVKWYKTAAEQAQAWAEQCGHHSHAEHPSVRWTSSYGACGQNVFISPTKKRWSQVLQHWWGAVRDFHYGGTNNLTEVAAFTQMAWYNSHQLGCGFSQCHTPGGTTFFRYVCNYCPAGNDPARLSRPYSEGSACSLCPGACRSLCPRRRCPLCTNACDYSDLWVNCAALNQQWHEWLCNTKTRQGVERFKNCRATCQCVNEIT